MKCSGSDHRPSGTEGTGIMINTELRIDPEFLREEVRCGYTVTRQRKEMWAVELDLLMQLDRVCRKYGLSYCVGAGTLLGAVRHKGFIPWDDDMDIYMLREDYDRLMEVSDEFQYPYFLQNSYTEENLLKTFSRLRNSETTGTTKMDEYRTINKGLFIDIFPLDGISPDRRTDRLQHMKNKLDRKLFECFNASRTPDHAESLERTVKRPFKKLLARVFVRDKIRFFRSFEDNLRRFSLPGTEMWGNRTLVFECPRSRRPYDEWKDLIYLPFEFLEVPVPRKYDEMLRQQYGDYMKIPEKKGGSMHGDLIISTSTGYAEYLEKLHKKEN